jgi:hypothetical protein
MVGKDNELGRAFLQLPRKVQMKKLMIARVFTALMFEPNSSLLSVIMDRDEGKVKDHIEHSGVVTWADFVKNANPDTSDK